MRVPVTHRLRRARIFFKTTTVVVIVAFLGLYLQPLAIAAHLPKHKTSNPVTKETTDEEKLANTLEKIEKKLERLETKLAKAQDVSLEKSDLKKLHKQLIALDRKAMKNFNRIEQHLNDKKLPRVILDRHYDAVATYKAELKTLRNNLDAVETATTDDQRRTKAYKAKEHLKSKRNKKKHASFDPNDLPHKGLRPNPDNKPRLDKKEYIRAGYISNPLVKVAAHGTFVIDQLPGADDLVFLAETTEVVLTDSIKAKAAELNHNPVEIYNWVRNNVEWLPTWGANQDADVTLGSQRGNAFDISSLLIALYRASDIPARYVHGTIEVPSEKFLNWAGGFSEITAASDFAASGGIPTTTVTSGGRITKVRMEHVWVEAAIDFQPSRGAINKSADTWVQLDPSFKQYEFLEGLDVIQISGLDTDALAQSFANSGTVNEEEGWSSGLDSNVLQVAQTQAETALRTYIADNLPNATIGDVFGGRKIILAGTSVLPTALPYRAILVGARYGALPAALQNAMTFGFGVDPLGEPIDPVAFPWASLSNHKVTLSFRPATAADEQTLASLLPAGPIDDPSQLPSSIPSYLISVIPELALDGEVVGQGNAMCLGEDLDFFYAITHLNPSGNQTHTYALPAGSYVNVAVVGGSVSSTRFDDLQTKLSDTETKLESGDAGVIDALTREEILGDWFQAGTIGYFGQYIALSHLTTVLQGARHNLPIGYGTLGHEPNVQTLFGFPRAIEPGGIAVDMRLTWATESLDGTPGKRRDIGLQVGLLSSALEHVVPEQMLNDPQTEGVSAVKALEIAAQQGQRIYHITPANQAQVLPNLNLDSLAMSEITQTLAIGKEVIAHTDRISVTGWTGEGYILFDPVTGDGAYKITGGSNGGFIFWVAVLSLATIIALSFVKGNVTGIFFGGLAFFTFLERTKQIARSNLSEEQMYDELNRAASIAVIGALGATALGALGGIGVVLKWFSRLILIAFGKVWFGD